MSTLTDRYVHAVTSQLPEEQREEIGLELRATIADSIEGQPGVDAQEAERAVLQDLGHPTLLADSYRGRGRALIGPAVYPAWLATLKLLLGIVSAVVAVIAVVVALAEDASWASAIAAAVTGAIQGAFQVVVWVTIGFAIAERTGADPQSIPLMPSKDWTPEQLPEVQERGTGLGEGLLMLASCTIGIVLLTLVNQLVRVDGELLPVFTDVALTWRWVAVAGLGLGVVTAALIMVRRRWTMGLAHVNLVGNLLIGLPLGWLLATRELFHPDVLVGLVSDTRDWVDLNHNVLLVILVVVLVWDTVDAYRLALKARRA